MGVIDERGVQWEHCNVCGKMVRLDNLGTVLGIAGKPCLDICVACVDAGLRARRWRFKQIIPAAEWQRKLVTV
jgi:hypothetical protein